MKHLNGGNPGGINLSMFCEYAFPCVCVFVRMFVLCECIVHRMHGGRVAVKDGNVQKLKIYYSNNGKRAAE